MDCASVSGARVGRDAASRRRRPAAGSASGAITSSRLSSRGSAPTSTDSDADPLPGLLVARQHGVRASSDRVSTSARAVPSSGSRA